MKITLADYLVKKLTRLGISDFFGLPGDFNFNIIEAVESSLDAKWINCTNELNAGYAADGYARVKGFGAVVTTFGVGELSAINAIAGSYSENVPVIKITGVPKTDMIKNNTILHHNFQKPDYYAFERAYSNVVETTAFLDKENAKREVDRIIDVMVKTRKPVYVSIPMDVCYLEVEDDIKDYTFTSDTEILDKAVEHIVNVVNSSQKPVIIADFPVKRYNLKEKFIAFANSTKFPLTQMLMAKGLVDETKDSFMGTYLGDLSRGNAHQIVQDSDCVITVGVLYSDLNTGGFSVMPDETFKVEIQSDSVVVEGIKYKNIWMGDLFDRLIGLIEENPHSYINDFAYEKTQITAEEPLKVEWLIKRLQEFLKENDMLFVETGIISYASGLMKLPENCLYNNQVLWGSIGWATPAVFGGAIADKTRRPILFTGEGSHQLTVQEVANMIHHNIKPVIIVLNNAGYTIERILSKDPMDNFNDITNWNYSKLPELFNGGEFYTAQAKTNKEFEYALMNAAEFQKDKLCYIEAFTDKMDVPQVSLNLVQNIKKNIKNKVLCDL